jgi:glycosyltransferase involved in cell wall biosynthesis
MALLEAQWLGLPAVVGDNGGVSDILNDQVTGFLAAPGDLPDFTAKLTTLIEDIGCREQMRAAATQITRSEHSFEMAAKKMDLLIKNSLNNYRVRR